VVKDELVDSLPLSLNGIYDLSFGHRLVGTGRVDFVRSTAVKPRISATEANSLRVDNAHVCGSERLAQSAAIVSVYRLVSQTGNTSVPLLIDLASFIPQFLDFLGGSIKRNLNFVHDSAKVVMEVGMQYVAYMLNAEALASSSFGDAHPSDIALPHVLDALSSVDKVVYLPFQHRLKVLLHFAAGHFHYYSQRYF
jgi:hypothetical protein